MCSGGRGLSRSGGGVSCARNVGIVCGRPGELGGPGRAGSSLSVGGVEPLSRNLGLSVQTVTRPTPSSFTATSRGIDSRSSGNRKEPTGSDSGNVARSGAESVPNESQLGSAEWEKSTAFVACSRARSRATSGASVTHSASMARDDEPFCVERCVARACCAGVREVESVDFLLASVVSNAWESARAAFITRCNLLFTRSQ